MTKEDAIYWIKNLAVLATEKDMLQIEEALNMAIEALKDRKTEPQTEKPKIRKRIDKPFRAVWLDDDHNEIGTTQTERAETMSCQECKWWFTDSLKHGGYCQSLLYNHECRYEPEVDCSWK